MENFKGIAKNFYPDSDEDGKISFTLREPIPQGSRVELVVRDVATGTRRGILDLSGYGAGSGYWWVPSPGNHTESRRNLGDVTLSLLIDGKEERKFYIDRGGAGKKIISLGKEIIYPDVRDSIYPTFWEIFIADEYQKAGDIDQKGVIVDIGSNYGLFSIYALDRYLPRRIVAVEPNKSCYSISKELLEEFPQFEILNVAVTPQTGRYSLKIVDDISATGVIAEDSNGDIDGIDINSLIERISEERIDLMKIDCEGGELGIFQTISDANLSRIQNLIIEYHNREIFKVLYERLKVSGFEIQDLPTSFASEEVGIITAKKI